MNCCGIVHSLEHFRCNETGQFKQYAALAKDIELTPNDTETFRLTGCMSSCEKYHYTADSVYERQWDYNGTNSYRIKFRFSNGKYERKEQVRRYRILTRQDLTETQIFVPWSRSNS